MHLARKNRLADAARTHLEALRGRPVVDVEDDGDVEADGEVEAADPESGPAAHAQGPPN